jgi:hypothetical protein
MDPSTRHTLSDAVTALTGNRPTRIRAIQPGRNNVVARVDVAHAAYLAKLYFVHPRDPRDRLAAEFSMLSFLHARGVTAVPTPVAADPVRHVALYTFIPRRPPTRGQLHWDHACQLADFLAALWRERRHPDARALPPAAEAAFSLRDYVTHLDRRFARMPASPTQPFSGAVWTLAHTRLRAAFTHAVTHLEREAARLHLDIDQPLPPSARTLSPADHGFHNTLLTPNGQLVFLDFEYAGWDDPAQMAANACLQPEIPMPPAWHPPFFRRLYAALGNDRTLALRLYLVYPLQVLKWSLILLNEFMPVDATRRAFAAGHPQISRSARLARVRRRAESIEHLLRTPNPLMRTALHLATHPL